MGDILSDLEEQEKIGLLEDVLRRIEELKRDLSATVIIREESSHREYGEDHGGSHAQEGIPEER